MARKPPVNLLSNIKKEESKRRRAGAREARDNPIAFTPHSARSASSAAAEMLEFLLN
jgi:hypothetical protein